jgi:hypothetical protein
MLLWSLIIILWSFITDHIKRLFVDKQQCGLLKRFCWLKTEHFLVIVMLSFCLFVCLSFVFLSIYLPSFCLYAFLSYILSVFISSFYLSFIFLFLSFILSVCFFASLSPYFSVFLSFCNYIFLSSIFLSSIFLSSIFLQKCCWPGTENFLVILTSRSKRKVASTY